MNNGIWIDPNTFVKFSDVVKDPLTTDVATRRNSLEFFSSFLGYLPDPDPVLRKQGKDIKVYHDIVTDPHISSVVEQRKGGVLSLEWDIDRGKAKSREVRIIKDIFDDLDIHNIINEILDAIFYGFQVLEVTFGKVGNMLVPVSVQGKPQEWFGFDEFNRLRFKTKQHPLEGVPVQEIYPRKFILAQNKPTYANPYGDRVLSKCFWPATFKKGGMKFWVTFTEKYGMPSIIGKQPRGLGKAAADELLDMLENMIQDAVAVIPDDSSVELKESASKGASSDVYLGLCNFMNSEISKAVLTATLTTEIQNKGSFAASETHADAVARLSQGDRKLPVKALNTLIKWIYEFNFPSSSTRAEFMIFDEEDVNKDVAERDKTLAETGVKFTKAYFKKTYSFADEDFEVEGPDLPQEKTDTSKKPAPAEFAEKSGDPEAGDKKGVKVLEKVLTDKKLQKEAEKLLKPVFDLLKESESLEDFVPLIADLFPELDTEELEETLRRLIFISEVFGRLEEDGKE
ncbi:MAG: DUF935 family protein [Ignavibacteria bacterium]|jgi:phage gp29-like protein|nr:DUF935 family protein [Ignavibacteria bacterium]MCU7503807.1 DUF935 family protein [Ignavibacteria bacterium]MCU7517179.1 DUF935 family protein [Ignavibacteria bacterium]